MELGAIFISATQVLVFIGVSQHTWLYTLYKFHLIKIAKLFIYRTAFDTIIFSIISYSLIKRIKNRTFSWIFQISPTYCSFWRFLPYVQQFFFHFSEWNNSKSVVSPPPCQKHTTPGERGKRGAREPKTARDSDPEDAEPAGGGSLRACSFLSVGRAPVFVPCLVSDLNINLKTS